MASKYFEEKNRLEKAAMPSVIHYLEEYGFKLVRDVRTIQQFQHQDIDLIMMDNVYGEITVEVKVRGTLYPDILLETISNMERDTLGWIYKSKATVLVYVFYINGKLHSRRYVMWLPKLRRWWEKNKAKYLKDPRSEKLAGNPPENPEYHTLSYAVPETDIPRHVFLTRFLK